jgi:hypothetical protein|tara:strand:+ start:242 stop:562 length:321 start_codon:yes stop_codon:yes gene_type:complete
MTRKSKSITLITDPLMEPYYISKDDMCYTVNERIIPDKDHFRSKGNGTEYAKPQGYYPAFDQALKKVAEEKLHTKKEYNSLREFLDEFINIKTKIKNYTDGIRSTV